MRRAVHGKHDGGRLRIPRALAARQRQRTRARRGRADVARRAGTQVVELVRRRLTPRMILTRGVRECDRRRGRDRRLDQRRASPPRDRARGGRAARSRRPSTASAPRFRCSRISSRAAGSSRRISTARAAPPGRAAAARPRGAARRRHDGQRRSIREEAAAAKETPGQEVVRPAAPLTPTGGLVILVATWRRMERGEGRGLHAAHPPRAGARVRQ